jgi:putative phage-type endonuclease
MSNVKKKTIIVDLEKPKSNRKRTKKMHNGEHLYFDDKLNMYYHGSLIGTMVMHSEYINFVKKLVSNEKTTLEYMNSDEPFPDKPFISNQYNQIFKLVNNENHCFQNASGKLQEDLIETNDKKISNVVYNKEHHINDFTFLHRDIQERDTVFYDKQIAYIKTLPQPEQRSEAWYELRKNRLTASELADSLGEGHFKSSNDIILAKCGLGPVFKGNAITQWGVKYEYVAIQIYEARNGVHIDEFGLVPHSTIPFLGASPDGISNKGIMLEIKCPPKRKIVGIVPHHYWVQMQLQLEVCNLEMCDFEECTLLEYRNESEYYLDGDCRLTGNELEKGVLIEYTDGTDKECYLYASLGLTKTQIDTWISKEKKRLSKCQYNNIKVTYWRLDTYSVTRVYRNRSWFENKLPLMKEFWQKVCFYRNVGCDELLVDIKNKKKQTYDVSDFEEYSEIAKHDESIINNIVFGDTTD